MSDFRRYCWLGYTWWNVTPLAATNRLPVQRLDCLKAPDGHHSFSFGEELAAGFNRAVIDPNLHARVGYYVLSDGEHGLEIFIHLRLGFELGD